jgi:hypothetical protein
MLTQKDLTLALQAAARLQRKQQDAFSVFRPAKHQEPVITCDATEILVRGGTRSGKSMIVAAIIAAYLLDREIIFHDGTRVRVREPAWQNRPVVVWMIGLQLNHIGQTLYRLLRMPGAFDVVVDEKTGAIRAWAPGVVPGDEDLDPTRRMPGPAFIPDDMVVSETWENRGEHKLTSMTLRNGSVVYAYASTAKVKRGDPVNRIWIDEEIENDNHYPEWQSRLSDRAGRLYWSSWPDPNCSALADLYARTTEDMDAVARGEKPRADFVNFQFVGSKTPFIAQRQKDLRRAGWTDAQIRARDLGEFSTHLTAAYPEFSTTKHGIGLQVSAEDRVAVALRENNWNAPSDWTVDLILDPGTQRPALLWGAVPTPDYWDDGEPYFVIYRELAVERIDAREIARRALFADKHRIYRRFIIDKKAGEQTPMGHNLRVMSHYSQHFLAQGLSCYTTGSHFQVADPVWITRSTALRGWMRTDRPCGRPQLRVVLHTCPHLVRQLTRTMRAVHKDDVKERLADGQIHDVLDCGEYWAGSHPVYQPHPVAAQAGDPWVAAFERETKYFDGLAASRKRGRIRTGVLLGAPD